MRFGLTLSLAEFRPEAGTCVGAPAALRIGPHGDGTASSPQRGPEVSELPEEHCEGESRRRGAFTKAPAPLRARVPTARLDRAACRARRRAGQWAPWRRQDGRRAPSAP